MKTYIFDKLDTADGYEIYWLHEQGRITDKYANDQIDPDDLYYCEYAFEERCRDIVLECEADGNVDYINYAFDEDEIELWKAEQRESQDYFNQISNTYPHA